MKYNESMAIRTGKNSHEAIALSEIDWNFPDRVTHSAIEGVHPYPAKFIAEIPRTLLTILPVPVGTAVLDPFCGSGTTLVESQRRIVPSIGIDLNPIADLISRVKTSAVPDHIEEVIELTKDLACRLDSVRVPNIPNLDHWFKKPVQIALASCGTAVASAPPEYRDILRLALSSIIVRVSNQESDTRYAAVNKDVDCESVFSGFISAARRITRALLKRDYVLSQSTVINADTLQIPARDIHSPVSLVITSPPYPNAYEYWLYHKYRMWWLGFDPLAVKQSEIGARAHFFKRNPHTAKHFVGQMTKAFGLLRSVVIPGGFACFLMGRSRIRGREIDNASIIEFVALSSGFSPVFRTERVIARNRKSFNLSHARIKTETVLVFRRLATKP